MTDTTGTRTGAPPERLVLQMWRTPVYQADCAGAAEHLPTLRELIERNGDTSGTMLTWDHPSIDWLRRQIGVAGEALARAVLGDAAETVLGDAAEIDGHGQDAEAWAVICPSGAPPRPRVRRDPAAWSGVLSVAADSSGDSDAGYLRMLDPRPAAADRRASSGAVRYSPVPGRMIAFPGWQAGWMKAAAADSRLRLAIAWNIVYREYRETRSRTS